MRVITKPEHSSLDWQKLRHRDPEGNAIFGASEAASVMNRSMYESRAEAILRKMLPPQTSEASPAMATGNLLEPTLIEEASRRLGIEIVTPELMFGRGRFVATPDGIDRPSLMRIESHAAMKKTPDVWVEAKCTSRYRVKSHDDIPETWRWQMSAQQYVTEAELFLIVLDADLHINLIEVPRNHEVEEMLVEQAELLGSIIDSGEFPTDDLHDLSAEQIAKLWKADDKMIELPPDALEWIDMLDEAKQQQKEFERMEQNAKDALARLMLDATIGTIGGEQIITWKEQAGRKSFDAKAFAEDNPTLYENYQKVGNAFRVMRITKKKGK